ncbi:MULTISPECIES: hypothetical protein [unclassified Nocardioides]|uniref:hypothetical protein n=1 Tax=unclassified Nocardioides TaxID=2615069 RepID=UPI0006FAA5E7|nr:MULTISPECIES: hypothetical protein [unclassified Nocardioides]KRA27231.1 hypothetical protein ASD81_24380 [Nocardioides sp. Root614]KRA91107.1 hypothetical protein ASD84_00080 [Nocardioides sp. Root682]
MGSPAWYIGLIVGAGVVLTVVVCVSTILSLARRISMQARELSLALGATVDNTEVLHVIPSVNDMIVTVHEAIGTLRTDVFEKRRAR